MQAELRPYARRGAHNRKKKIHCRGKRFSFSLIATQNEAKDCDGRGSQAQGEPDSKRNAEIVQLILAVHLLLKQPRRPAFAAVADAEQVALCRKIARGFGKAADF